jgi:hypothetical protein
MMYVLEQIFIRRILKIYQVSKIDPGEVCN